MLQRITKGSKKRNRCSAMSLLDTVPWLEAGISRGHNCLNFEFHFVSDCFALLYVAQVATYSMYVPICTVCDLQNSVQVPVRRYYDVMHHFIDCRALIGSLYPF
jgi:hypothetical protein